MRCNLPRGAEANQRSGAFVMVAGRLLLFPSRVGPDGTAIIFSDPNEPADPLHLWLTSKLRAGFTIPRNERGRSVAARNANECVFVAGLKCLAGRVVLAAVQYAVPLPFLELFN